MPQRSRRTAAARAAARHKPARHITPAAIYRVFLLHQRLCRGASVTAGALAEEIGMSGKTVRRAIATMREELGAPIAFDSAANTFCYTRPCEFLPMVRIEPEEAFAFAMLAAIFAGAPDVPLGGAFASVLEKLKPILGGVVSFPLDEVRRAIALP